MRDLRQTKTVVSKRDGLSKSRPQEANSGHTSKSLGNDLGNALFRHFLKWRPELIPHMELQNNTTDGISY